MMTAEDYLKKKYPFLQGQALNRAADKISYADVTRRMIEFAEEAIKEDREKVFRNANLCLRTYISGGTMEKNIGEEVSTERENEYYGIDRDSIINTPQIELK